jgi:glycosyltransferase involved in cell wall biosynthesis
MRTSPLPRVEVAQVVTRCIAGAGGVAVRGALALDPERYHVTLVTGQGGPLTDRAAAHGIDVVVEPSLVSPVSPRDDARALGRLTRLFAAGSFDVVHTHSAKAGAVGRLAAHRSGVPVIVHTYHGFPFHEFQGVARRAAYVAIERRLSRITDVVLAIGSGVATEALRRGLARPNALRTVTPVVEADVVRANALTRAAARTALGLPPGATVVGTVGRMDYQKAPEHMLEAIARMRHHDAILVWVGSGPLEEETRALAERLGVSSRVRLLGERSDVAALLPALDVFAMSSRYEGLPCAVVEAMRCGLPVVATAVNSVPDLVVPGESGVLVRPGNPAELAEALDGLVDDPGTTARLALRGQELAGRPYDAAQLATVLDEVYSGGLAGNALALAG